MVDHPFHHAGIANGTVTAPPPASLQGRRGPGGGRGDRPHRTARTGAADGGHGEQGRHRQHAHKGGRPAHGGDKRRDGGPHKDGAARGDGHRNDGPRQERRGANGKAAHHGGSGSAPSRSPRAGHGAPQQNSWMRSLNGGGR
jgi:hypothetical protein